MDKNAWINQLQEVVLVFDVSTWFLLIISPVIVCFIVSYALDGCMRQCIEVFEIYCGFVSAFLDQGSSLFYSVKLKNSLAIICGIFSVPLMFALQNNEYKG